MRRKTLLFFVVAVFVAGGIFGYRTLHSHPKNPEPQYIGISDWGNSKVEVPPTGGPTSRIAVIHPNELVALTRSEPKQAEQAPDGTVAELGGDAVIEPAPDNLSQPNDAEGQTVNEAQTGMEDQIPNDNSENLDNVSENEDLQSESPTSENNNSQDQNPQVASEDLDNLERPTLPGSAVLEVLPPNQQMSDEVLDSAINSLNQADRPDNASQPEATLRRDNQFNLLMGLQSIIVLGLGGYLTYWHFRR